MIYGHDRTIHRSQDLDVEVGPDGRVVAVWFRCMMLPFTEHRVSAERAADMARATPPALLAVEVEPR